MNYACLLSASLLMLYLACILCLQRDLEQMNEWMITSWATLWYLDSRYSRAFIIKKNH